jgi:hypothetical protein
MSESEFEPDEGLQTERERKRKGQTHDSRVAVHEEDDWTCRVC